MHKALQTVYNAGEIDNWSGKLIQIESDKVHETIRILATNLTQIICAPNASKENKAWAKDQLEKLFNTI